MDLASLIEQLSDPGAYPSAVSTVEVRHTHISVVFLAGPYAYKIKKPVQLGFLDFGTLERRHHFCEEEVRLNRRLASEVYLGVVPVTMSGKRLQMDGHGEPVEWAVKMQRLPEEATLEKRLGKGEVGIELIRILARKIAAFHAQADTDEAIAARGRFEVVAGNAWENFEQAAAQVGSTLSRTVYDRLRSLTEQALADRQALIEKRARSGVIRDTHGDLHLDHVYLLRERSSLGDLVIIDCIEFNTRFRFADPIADMAFLVMDLTFHGRRDLAAAFAEEYFGTSHDEEGRSLLPFYTSYRAAVRGKVEGFELAEKEVPDTERAAAGARARAHWLSALDLLEEPQRRPCLVLVGGLPGTGKSTLAAALAEDAGLQILRSDVIRKELAGAPAGSQPSTAFEDGLYTTAWTERTYAECLRRTEELLFEGKRVLVDASFREEKHRRSFLEAAQRWGVRSVLLLCRAEPEVVRQRLENRRGDASDADWRIYLQAAMRWEDPSPPTRRFVRELHTGGHREGVLAVALDVLGELEIANPLSDGPQTGRATS
ncbi:MAG TPA: AAA family ATPase [Gemmataceae bacterium]|nr:AAA family ATPase [Gemmataceae bacterium]